MAPSARESIHTLSLRAHLLLLVIGTMLPALLVSAMLVRRVVADNRTAVERALIDAARSEAAIVDAELQGTIRALQGLAQSDRLTNAEIAAFYLEAQRLLATQSTWSAISLSTPDGREIANTARPFGEPLQTPADPDGFDHAVSTKRPVIGNLRLGENAAELDFPVRVPVIRDDRVIYVVAALITTRSFASVLTKEIAISEEWVRGVVDADGVLVARSRDLERFVGQKGTPGFLQRLAEADEGVYRDIALDGTSVYGAFTRAPVSRWVAGVAVPNSVVDAPFRQSMFLFGIVGLVLLAVGGGATYLISRRISQDISQSTTDAEALAGGRRPSHRASQVTELQRLNDALGRSAVLLETRQRERDEHVARADAARAEAEAADRAKDQFLALLGHELRNPLAPALTALHLIKNRAGADTTRERDIIERQIRHMARLVDDLLDVSRLRRGAIELRPETLDLADAVESAVEMTGPLFAEKQHDLDVRVPRGLFVDADRIRIAQVLANVLSNAAKYTPHGGQVALRAHQEDASVVVECRDNGIGMAADLVPHVFDLFVQGQRGLDRRQGGLGLGLAVARTLVDLHGGTIEASSEGVNRGSTFVIRLPLARAAASSPAASVETPATSRVVTGRVMVVDDNRDALEMLIDALTEAGFDAVGTSTSIEALDLAVRLRPQVAILDIGLPDMDGFDLARSLLSLTGAAPLRLIALTGYGQEQDMAAGRLAGFDAFFVKPVEIPALIESLEELLS